MKRLRDLRPGPVHAVGTIAGFNDPLVTPFSGTPCVWWGVTMMGSSSTVKFDEEHGSDFLLRDDTGELLVRGGRTRVQYPPRVQHGFGALVTRLAAVDAFLAERRRRRGWADAVFERYLAEGARVVVEGKLLAREPAMVGYREAPPRRELVARVINVLG